MLKSDCHNNSIRNTRCIASNSYAPLSFSHIPAHILPKSPFSDTIYSGDTMDLKAKLKILSDSAKYDASCSSSNSSRKNSGGIGNAASCGICHSWSEDGRCISLLKILFTNVCIYDCEYCINRASNDVPRASFTPEEVAELTMNFYIRNYIEGLFLSSAVIKSPDYTMEQLIRTAELLRNTYHFNGYIHMKVIPGASKELVTKLSSLIDRVSVNIELPTEKSLKMLAPQKTTEGIMKPMNNIKLVIAENKEDRLKYKSAPLIAPAGQTTQMIIGAANESDETIITKASLLYKGFSMKRVYYSAFVPVVKSKYTSSIKAAPLLREHRIYQADWLMRFYKFKPYEIVSRANPMLDLDLDPKAFWAINHIELFPIEVNKASYEELLRVPGFGPTTCHKIINARRFARLSYDSLENMHISLKRAKYFITVGGVYRGGKIDTRENLRIKLMDKVNLNEQLSLF